MPNFITLPPKDPSAKLDYIFDWAAERNNRDLSDWLLPDETIVDMEVTAETGITIVSSSRIDDDTAVLVWLSGGSDGEEYKISCKITTSLEREDSRTAIVPVKIR